MHALDELAALRGERGKSVRDETTARRKPSGEDTPAAAKPSGKGGPPATTSDEDAALLRAAFSGVAPLRDSGHVELDAPKPAPFPRPREPDTRDTGPTPAPARRAAPGSDAALFRELMADVTPLRDTGRVDVGIRRRARLGPAHPGTPSDDPARESRPPLLPPDPERLSDEELFHHAVRGAVPIDQHNRVELARPQPEPQPIKRSEDEREVMRETMEAPLTLEDRLDIGEEAAFLRPGLPRRILTDLRRGRWVLQAELDLHGLNREQARAALAEFLARNLQQGRRCVRVIHGKGIGSPGRQSILKQLSRGWLAQREEILAFCQAGPHHGGEGALVVLLRGPSGTRA
ncbi:MAG TPA: Smr/MutS family protein [Rhodocyclaceae bacterium]|nr:Smr/MutS family protein [Rhodocyclaceae bacterium]